MTEVVIEEPHVGGSIHSSVTGTIKFEHEKGETIVRLVNVSKGDDAFSLISEIWFF